MNRSFKRKYAIAVLSAAGAFISLAAEAGQGPQPNICTRACWGARAPNCSITQMSGLSRAIVHHTAGTGDYSTSLENSKAVMRNVQNYHMSLSGWCDIAYHFLVDAAGNIFEGRSGAWSGLPRGTHDGCNANSFGFTALGYYHPPYNQTFTAASRSAMEAVIAWRMPSAWSPYGSGTYCSTSVGFMDGHYRVKATACPGDVIIPQIAGMRDGVNARKNGCSGGAIPAKYNEKGGAGGGLGSATSAESATARGDGCYQHFQGGSIFYSGGTGAHDVRGAIRDRWAGLNWELGPLGFPTSDDAPTARNDGYYTHFQGGSIFWSPATGAQDVRGRIRDKWAEHGWELGFLGFPTTSDAPAINNTGYYTHFQGGSIFWSPSTDAHSVQGAIRDKWAQLGWETGFLGYPTSDETSDAIGGRYSNFQGGAISWSPATGAHETHGPIRTKWGQLGYEGGCLGYPTSDVYASGSGQRQDFQYGYITYDSVNGAVSSCGNPPPKVDVTMDNSGAGFSVVGNWATGTGATDKFGADYRYRSTAAVSEPATWTANLSTAASYTVYAWWSQGSNRSATAPFVVYHSAGSTTISVNQQVNGGKWNSLGGFNLNSGNNQVKLSCWTTTGYIVLADAVRWVQQ